MRNGAARKRHADQSFLGDLDPLADGRRNLFGLSEAKAHMAIAVTHDDERAEREVFSSLDDFRDAVDADDLVFEVELAGIDCFS